MIVRRHLLANLQVRFIQLSSRSSNRTMTVIPGAPTPPKPNLIAVIGTTGVGKSQLGVELAQSLSLRTSSPLAGEIINHDSMQCYKGLNVITNKATIEEMDGVPHHLMDFLAPGQEWGVTEFQKDALNKVSSG